VGLEPTIFGCLQIAIEGLRTLRFDALSMLGHGPTVPSLEIVPAK